MAKNRAFALAYLGYLNPRIKNLYTTKIITYGKYQEHHNYTKTRASFSPQEQVRKRNIRKQKSYYALSRAQQKVFQIATANHEMHGNYKTTFFTPTFRKNITNRKQADKLFRLFIIRLNDYLGYKIKYIAVPEIQTEREKNTGHAVIHYHVIFFNLKFINKEYLEKIWKHGSTNISVVENLKSVSRYLAKYLTKDVFKQTKPHQKTYLSSRGLHLPSNTYTINPDRTNKKQIFTKKYKHKTITIYEDTTIRKAHGGRKHKKGNS